MYDFHLNDIKTKYGDNAGLLFINTDSLAYENKKEDFYFAVEKWFETSDHPANTSGIKTGVNCKVLGMFKDEAGGKHYVEFVV